MVRKTTTGEFEPEGQSGRKSSKKSRPEVELNPTWTNSKRRERIAKQWQQQQEANVDPCFNALPFPHCVLPDLLTDSCVRTVEESLMTSIIYSEKDSDLFRFRQSADLSLKDDNDPIVKELVKVIRDDVGDLLRSITNLPLKSSPVDIFSAQYLKNDYLLCHDDQLEGRRIAFILYLTPEDWSIERDGGSLDLFNDQALKVMRRLTPTRNTLVFFEVSNISFHQVAEVLTEDKTRLSVGGWFHMDEVNSNPQQALPSELSATLPFERALEDVDEELFYTLINPSYLDEDTQSEVQKSFEDNSEISLANFLNESFYHNLCSELTNIKEWETLGVAHRRRIKVMNKNVENEKKCVADLMKVFKSDAMFLLLSKLTGLELHPLAVTNEDEATTSTRSTSATTRSSSSRCCLSIRRWERDCYTLLADHDEKDNGDYALDTILYLLCDGWSSTCGGQTIYVAKDDDSEQLLTSTPQSNTLSLVYRDNETVGFVKKINSDIDTAMDNKAFFDIQGIYKET